jgi:hypothetical protein
MRFRLLLFRDDFTDTSTSPGRWRLLQLKPEEEPIYLFSFFSDPLCLFSVPLWMLIGNGNQVMSYMGDLGGGEYRLQSGEQRFRASEIQSRGEL